MTAWGKPQPARRSTCSGWAAFARADSSESIMTLPDEHHALHRILARQVVARARSVVYEHIRKLIGDDRVDLSGMPRS